MIKISWKVSIVNCNFYDFNIRKSKNLMITKTIYYYIIDI